MDPSQLTKDGLQLLFKNGKDSDVTIRFGRTSLRLHKAILMSKSSWFRAAFSGKFKKATARVVWLEGDDEAALWLLFRFCYSFGVTVPWKSSTLRTFEERKLREKFAFYTAIQKAADKYDVPPLCERVIRWVDDDLRNVVHSAMSSRKLENLVQLVYDQCPAIGNDFRKCMHHIVGVNFRFFCRWHKREIERILTLFPDLCVDIAMHMSSALDDARLENREALGIGTDARPYFLDPCDLAMTVYKSADWSDFKRRYSNSEYPQSDIQDKTSHGETALDWAASRSTSLKIIQCLVTWAYKTGYDILKQRIITYGRTALEWAKASHWYEWLEEDKNRKIIEYLESQTINGGAGEQCCGSNRCRPLVTELELDPSGCSAGNKCAELRKLCSTMCAGARCCQSCEIARFVELTIFEEGCEYCYDARHENSV